MANQPAITVVGSIMIDMISYVPRLPKPGETLIGGRFEIGFGGKGANQAVMARRLGASVRMIACVGNDAFGDQAVANLVAQGIDAQFVNRSQAATGVAPIWVEADGTNRIAVIPGANDDMDPRQVAAAVLAQPPGVVIGELEVPQPVTLAGFGAARRAGSVTILNPAPAANIDPELLALTDWLIPNETEFASLVSSLLSTEVASVTDHGVLALASSISPRLLVTLGEAGALMVEDGAAMRLPAPLSQVVDTTGAGDAFVGAFGYGLASGLAPAAAMSLALRCASFSVGRRGTQSSFPTAEESERLLKGVADG
ncbi:MAG: ribokinase [Acidimicrobiales bacterium]|jgi:ribokinase